MAISNFDKFLLIEQVRYIETAHPLACDYDADLHDHSEHRDFEDRLWLRARFLVDQQDLSSLLGRAASLFRYVKTAALGLAVLLGALGIFYAISDSQTINIYWLLLVLLGFNLLSMLLWLTGTGLNIDGLTSGVLARLTGWLTAHLESQGGDGDKQDRKSYSRLADRAWLACNFSGVAGKWLFSKVTHQLWLAYLSAGLIFIVLLLMVRQYDFVWGTTLLSDAVFVRLTETLSVPLDAIGFATPTAEQVQDTRVGGAQALSVEHRTHWAQFLLGSLLCFGILPRLLLWFWSAIMYRRARGLVKLDYYLPYYIRLRQRLMPLASHGQVVDADTSPALSYRSTQRTPVPHVLPAETQWVAVEIGDEISWPLESISAMNDLGRVIDRDSLRTVLQKIQDKKSQRVAVAVCSARSPDRGVQRTIASLVSGSEQRWLVLLQKNGDEPVSTSRMASWYRLADACKVPADHVISLSLTGGVSDE